MTASLQRGMAGQLGPRYVTSIPDGVGNAYVTLADEWGQRVRLPGLDQVIVHVDLATGYEAQIRFFKDDVPGPAFPLFVGVNVLSDQARYGFDGFELRNADAGSNAKIIYMAQAV